MKYFLIIFIFLLGCGGDNEQKERTFKLGNRYYYSYEVFVFYEDKIHVDGIIKCDYSYRLTKKSTNVWILHVDGIIHDYLRPNDFGTTCEEYLHRFTIELRCDYEYYCGEMQVSK